MVFLNKDGRKSGEGRNIRRINPEELDSFSPDFIDEDEDFMEFDVDESDVERARELGREKAERMEREKGSAGQKSSQNGKAVKKMSLDGAEEDAAPANRKRQAGEPAGRRQAQQTAQEKTARKKAAVRIGKGDSASGSDIVFPVL